MKKNNALPSPERERQSVIENDKTSLSKIYYTISGLSCQEFFERKFFIMSIWEKIYDAYCEGLLSIQPPEPSAWDDFKLSEIEKKFSMTPEQIAYFENEFFNLSINIEKRMFKAGFKIALRLISE